LVTLALLGALAVLALSGAASTTRALAAAVALSLLVAGVLQHALRAARRGAVAESLAACYAGYAAACRLRALVAFPGIHRWHDLGGRGRRLQADRRGQPLALLVPDETTLAVIDHGSPGTFSVLERDDAATVRAWLVRHGSQARLLVLLPGHAPGEVTRWLSR